LLKKKKRWKEENLNKEIVKKNKNIYASFVVLVLSLGLLFIYTTTIQSTQIFTYANAATTNATQGAKSTANQTGEKMQAGATNATQGVKSTANQAGQTGQSIMNKTGETLQSFANKTGEVLQKINPLK
jgi:hypothetical protein